MTTEDDRRLADNISRPSKKPDPEGLRTLEVRRLLGTAKLVLRRPLRRPRDVMSGFCETCDDWTIRVRGTAVKVTAYCKGCDTSYRLEFAIFDKEER